MINPLVLLRTPALVFLFIYPSADLLHIRSTTIFRIIQFLLALMVRIKSPRTHLDGCIYVQWKRSFFFLFSCVHLNYPATGEFIFSYYISVAIIKDKLRDLYNLLNHLTAHSRRHRGTKPSTTRASATNLCGLCCRITFLYIPIYMYVASQTGENISKEMCVFRVGLV